MKYLSVCSGIEAATVAWHPLGWHPVAFAEIEPFPCAVLKHHYPDVPNLGDLTRYATWPDLAPDLLVGGTPCQSFSVAGLRKGMADPRGNLALVFLGLLDRLRPRWVVWENVPGVLSSGEGRDFGSFLGALGELGYGWAYRSLDAQYFGLAQRRERVFVVGHLGDWRPPAAVLFEPESLSGHPAPSRETGERVAPTIASRPTGGGGLGTDFDLDGGVMQYAPEVSPAMKQRDSKGPSSDGDGDGLPLVACVPINTQIATRHNALGESTGFGIGEEGDPAFTLQSAHSHAVAIRTAQTSANGHGIADDVAHALDQANGQAVASTLKSNSGGGGFGSDPSETFIPVSVAIRGRDGGPSIELGDDKANALLTPNGGRGGIGIGAVLTTAVRRLTPRECERLQGFPDDYTLVPYRGKPAADGPRYKALGNSMAVPVMRWIGRQVAFVEAEAMAT